MLNLETKQKLNTIINVEKFENKDELLAVLAYVLLASKRKNELRSVEIAELSDAMCLSDVLNLRFRSRDYRLYGISLNTAGFLRDVQEELQDIEDVEEFLIKKAEELANNLDNISNVKLLQAIRNVELANEQVQKEIKALETAVLLENGEKAQQVAQEQGLPALSGSPKQIAWAEQIRTYCLANLPANKIGGAKRATTAKYWIDNFRQYLPRER
ncbi:TPA: hypothetical protein ACPDI7_002030 [Pasteurella multocida]